MSLMIPVGELDVAVRPLIERLVSESITIVEVYEGTDQTDAGVELIDDYSIQVCQDGTMCLIHEEDDGLNYLFESDNMNEFLTVLKEFV